MSYCRFENTLDDFNDCVENINSLNKQSTEYEFEARENLIYSARNLLLKLELEDLHDMEGFKDCIKKLNYFSKHKQSFYRE